MTPSPNFKTLKAASTRWDHVSQGGGGSWKASWRRRDPGLGCTVAQRRSRPSGRAAGPPPEGCTAGGTCHTPASARVRSRRDPSEPGRQHERSCQLQHRVRALWSVHFKHVYVYLHTHTVINTGYEKRFYSVLLQESSCFSLISNGQPDVWERGETVAETTTHFHFDGLARGNWAHGSKRVKVILSLLLSDILWDSRETLIMDGKTRLTEGRIGGVVTAMFICSIRAVVPSITQPLLLQTLACAAGELVGSTSPFKWRRTWHTGGWEKQKGTGHMVTGKIE